MSADGAVKDATGCKPHSLQAIRDALAAVRLHTLPVAKGKVLWLDSALRPSEAYTQLLTWQISAAPVYDATAQRYIGMLDLRDLIRFVVARYDAAEVIAVERKKQQSAAKPKASTSSSDAKFSATTTAVTATSAAKPKANAPASITEYIDRLLTCDDPELRAQTLSLHALCRNRPVVTVSADATLLDAAKLLCGSTRQVCVLESVSQPPAVLHASASSGNAAVGSVAATHGTTYAAIRNVISQSTIVAAIHQRRDALKDALSGVVEIGASETQQLVSVLSTDRTIDALRKLSSSDVAGVVVRNAHGWYADTLQARHFKLFLSRRFSVAHFDLPIAEYLLRVRAYESQHRTLPAEPYASCPTLPVESDGPPSLGTLVSALATAHAHCLYLTTTLQLPLKPKLHESKVAAVAAAAAEVGSDGKVPTKPAPALAAATAAAAAAATEDDVDVWGGFGNALDDPLIVLPVTSVSLGDVLRTVCIECHCANH